MLSYLNKWLAQGIAWHLDGILLTLLIGSNVEMKKKKKTATKKWLHLSLIFIIEADPPSHIENIAFFSRGIALLHEMQ